jgi:hypothetical protein
MELLNDMLEFNPFFRPTAAELLTYKIFDKIRPKTKPIVAEHKIVIVPD